MLTQKRQVNWASWGNRTVLNHSRHLKHVTLECVYLLLQMSHKNTSREQRTDASSESMHRRTKQTKLWSTPASWLQTPSILYYSPTSWSNGLVVKRGIIAVLTTAGFCPFTLLLIRSVPYFIELKEHNNDARMGVKRSQPALAHSHGFHRRQQAKCWVCVSPLC